MFSLMAVETIVRVQRRLDQQIYRAEREGREADANEIARITGRVAVHLYNDASADEPWPYQGPLSYTNDPYISHLNRESS